jgi:predicted SprT family Zn-dependent metalloprotease
MKDLTKELYFEPNASTTVNEVKALFEAMLELDWTIDIFRNKSAKTINLKDLGWRIEYSNTKTAAGTCKWGWRRNEFGDKEIRYGTKRVQLSMHFLSQAENLVATKGAEWEEVIRHELAHAVDVEMRNKSNHDRQWVAIANAMLSSGRITFSREDLEDNKESKYTLKCIEEECDYSRPSHKKRKANARRVPCCTTCYNAGKGYKHLVQVQNY